MERERKRLEQFRRLRKEIRGSQDYLVVGIDISKDTHNALMRNTSGKILYRRLTFNNTGEGFETLLLQVEAVRVGHGLKEVVFEYQARGSDFYNSTIFASRSISPLVLSSACIRSLKRASNVATEATSLPK